MLICRVIIVNEKVFRQMRTKQVYHRPRQGSDVGANPVAIGEEVAQGDLYGGRFLAIPVEPQGTVAVSPGVHRHPDVLDHPWASDGEVIYFNMSQWGPYNVRLMRARLVKAESQPVASS